LAYTKTFQDLPDGSVNILDCDYGWDGQLEVTCNTGTATITAGTCVASTCVDSPGWTNGYGHDCDEYRIRGWCEGVPAVTGGGGFVSGYEVLGETGHIDIPFCLNVMGNSNCGVVFNEPSLNCCICGKV
jgi:hypothetical protein